jgi:hypothetical protein
MEAHPDDAKGGKHVRLEELFDSFEWDLQKTACSS